VLKTDVLGRVKAPAAARVLAQVGWAHRRAAKSECEAVEPVLIVGGIYKQPLAGRGLFSERIERKAF
jgi:hypothetical protein